MREQAVNHLLAACFPTSRARSKGEATATEGFLAAWTRLSPSGAKIPTWELKPCVRKTPRGPTHPTHLPGASPGREPASLRPWENPALPRLQVWRDDAGLLGLPGPPGCVSWIPRISHNLGSPHLVPGRKLENRREVADGFREDMWAQGLQWGPRSQGVPLPPSYLARPGREEATCKCVSLHTTHISSNVCWRDGSLEDILGLKIS